VTQDDTQTRVVININGEKLIWQKQEIFPICLMQMEM
jgi:hypothetical protein